MQISKEAIQPFSEEKLFRKTEDIKNDVVIINLYISNHVVVVLQGVGEMVVQGTLLPIDLRRITAHAIYESLFLFQDFPLHYKPTTNKYWSKWNIKRFLILNHITSI